MNGSALPHVNNEICLRRLRKVVLPEAGAGGGETSRQQVATLLKNLEPLGYVFSERLIRGCLELGTEQLTALYCELSAPLKQTRGAHRPHRPMYPGFPEQVMALPEAELYLNALLHYWSDGQYFPDGNPAAGDDREGSTAEATAPTTWWIALQRRLASVVGASRAPLSEATTPVVLDAASVAEFEALFTRLAGGNSSLSEQDRDDLAWFAATYRDDLERLLPERIPKKETVAHLAGLLLKYTTRPQPFLERYLKTATDVLRLAVALSDGDLSLAQPVRFRKFSRPERRLLLGLLEACSEPTEDMLRWKGRWVRLGERLHPGEYASRYPKSYAAFDVLRNDRPFETFNQEVELALERRDLSFAMDRLVSRPGYLARRLDHLLRLDPERAEEVISRFSAVASKIATPVLLEVSQHFRGRRWAGGLRVFFPKGQVAKAQAIANELPPLPEAVCAAVIAACEAALVERFRALPPLGRVFLDPQLGQFKVPFAVRSASRSFRTLARGSRLPLPECEVLRFFVWWTNGSGRTDIDLSATLLDGEFNYVDILSYYNLKSFGGAHSGDIVDAPHGASEFIDLTIARLLEEKVRYVVMSLTSYTQQPYCELPECFAGWMARSEPNSGEIYEPRTVQDRVDLTADTRIALPLVIDLVERQVIWCDLALRNHPYWQNNVHANLKGINFAVRSMVELNKPNLYTLLRLHVQARGELVERPEQAETLFSVAAGTPFETERIAAEFLS